LTKEDGAAFREQYRLRFSGNEAYRTAVWKILCSRVFSRFISADACVLDVGSGWGEFINNVAAAEKLAMDLNPDAGSRLSQGIRFLNQDCSRPWELAAATLDVVFTSNFLEHLPEKAGIERVVAEAYRCLREGGLLICMGPNIRYVPGKYWDFFDHHLPLTELSVAEVLQLNGFTIERSTPRFLPYSMSAGRTPPLILVKAYLRLPWLWPLLGRQFLVVGRKRAADRREAT
jgi:SAM-dependent methyltransferase